MVTSLVISLPPRTYFIIYLMTTAYLFPIYLFNDRRERISYLLMKLPLGTYFLFIYSITPQVLISYLFIHYRRTPISYLFIQFIYRRSHGTASQSHLDYRLRTEPLSALKKMTGGRKV